MNLEPNYILASLIFGVFGAAYFLYGKRQSRTVPLLVGIVLSVFPYFITDLKVMVPLGVALIFVPAFIKTA